MIAAADAVALGIAKEGDANIVGVVISHDCDLAVEDLDEEPFVEILVGLRVDKLSERFSFAKHPRRLALEFSAKEGGKTYVELLGSRRLEIDKNVLAPLVPDTSVQLPAMGIRILQRWLASRYHRQALPDGLVDRLRPIFRQLEKASKGNAAGIVGFWLDYQPRENILPPEEPYELWINVVYAIDDPEYEKKAKVVAEALRQAIVDEFQKDGRWSLIELRQCHAVSERAFTLRDMRETVEYKLEHISLRAGNGGALSP